MTNDIHLNYINGEWKEGYDTIENINPSDVSDVVGFYAKANSADCEAAIQAASSAFSDWSQSALEQRKKMRYWQPELQPRNQLSFGQDWSRINCS